jgi:kynureninase
LGFVLNSPRDVTQRGSHISLGHADGWRIDQALIYDKNVLPDFRKPDNIRIGIAPLYNSFVDIYEAVSRMKQIVDENIFERYSRDVPVVT